MTETETAPFSDSVGAPASDCALDAEPEELRRIYQRAVWDHVTGHTQGMPAEPAPSSEPAPFSDSVGASASRTEETQAQASASEPGHEGR